MSTAKKKPTERKEGELRMSSAMLGAGPGALFDLPDASVMIAGLDHWGNPLSRREYGPQWEEVKDDRLRGYVTSNLGATDPVRLFHPAPAEDKDGVPSLNGIRAWEFPEWFVTRDYVDPLRTDRTQRSRILVHRRALTKGKLAVETPRGAERAKGDDGKPKKVVPVRFVRACIHGHVEDIDWQGFAHPNKPNCHVPKSLRLEERGTSGDLAELFVVCVLCETEQSLVRATEFNQKMGKPGALGWCRGRETWKGKHAEIECKTEGQRTVSRPLVRSATNAWFPAALSAITLPSPDVSKSELRKMIDAYWETTFAGMTEASDVKVARKNPNNKAALAPFTDDEVAAECLKRIAEETEVKAVSEKKSGGPKLAELDAFLAVNGFTGLDEMGSVFFAESIDPPQRRGHGTRPFIDRVVLAHRLREVRALVGFTRFEAPLTSPDGSLDLNPSQASLAGHKQWVPAVENHGEGLFFSLDPGRVLNWLGRGAVKARAEQFDLGFEKWRTERGNPKALPLGMPYVLLHSLSHLLITAMALECGYPSSAIRERIYTTADRFGILLYTASPDAEGTLGGLVATGRSLERHLQEAMEIGRLCSNDPVCAGHDPNNASGELTLQGAACHGCLLISESSCERQNTWLDRATVVPTVVHRDVAFFEGW